MIPTEFANLVTILRNCVSLFFVAEFFLIENQQSASDDRRGACLYAESKTSGANIKTTGCNETDERQNWAYTLKGQIMVSIFTND